MFWNKLQKNKAPRPEGSRATGTKTRTMQGSQLPPAATKKTLRQRFPRVLPKHRQNRTSHTNEAHELSTEEIEETVTAVSSELEELRRSNGFVSYGPSVMVQLSIPVQNLKNLVHVPGTLLLDIDKPVATTCPFMDRPGSEIVEAVLAHRKLVANHNEMLPKQTRVFDSHKKAVAEKKELEDMKEGLVQLGKEKLQQLQAENKSEDKIFRKVSAAIDELNEMLEAVDGEKAEIESEMRQNDEEISKYIHKFVDPASEALRVLDKILVRNNIINAEDEASSLPLSSDADEKQFPEQVELWNPTPSPPSSIASSLPRPPLQTMGVEDQEDERPTVDEVPNVDNKASDRNAWKREIDPAVNLSDPRAILSYFYKCQKRWMEAVTQHAKRHVIYYQNLRHWYRDAERGEALGTRTQFDQMHHACERMLAMNITEREIEARNALKLADNAHVLGPGDRGSIYSDPIRSDLSLVNCSAFFEVKYIEAAQATDGAKIDRWMDRVFRSADDSNQHVASLPEMEWDARSVDIGDSVSAMAEGRGRRQIDSWRAECSRGAGGPRIMGR